MAKQLTDEAVFIAYKIKEARIQKYDTIKAASDAYGTAQSHWSHWETALSVPHKSTLARIVEFFKLEPDYFSTKPENWEKIKKDFVHDLQRGSRKNKSYYKSHHDSSMTHTTENTHDSGSLNGPSIDDGLDDFMEIVALINNARKKVRAGKVDLETFKKQMKTVADMIEVTTLGL